MDNKNPQITRVPYLIHESQIPAGEIKQRHLVATTTIAKGDIYYGDGNNGFVRLPVGANGQFMKVVGGVPVWATPGVSGTIHLAALTGPGTQGSITVVNGIITAFVDPT